MKWRGRLDLALDYEFLKIDKGFRFFYVQQQIMICEIKKKNGNNNKQTLKLMQ